MKKNLLTVLILLLLAVNLALTSIMMFSMSGTNKKTAELVTNIATALNLELTYPGGNALETSISMADTAVHTIEGSMTIPLKTEAEDEGLTYIMFNIAFSMNTTHEDYEMYGETIGERDSLIKDAITTTVGRFTEAECRNDFDMVKEEILLSVQQLFQSDFIYSVAVNDIRFG